MGRGPPLLLDARVLIWVLVAVFVTGVPLLFTYDADPARYRGGLAVLRGLHAASTAVLLAGAFGHLVWRVLATPASRRGVRSGGWMLASVGFATVSGVLSVASPQATAVWALVASGPRPVPAAVVHVAYSLVLVALTATLHVGPWRHRLLHGPWRLAAAAGLVLAAAAIAPLPARDAFWSVAAVPPVQGLWLWSVAVGVAVALAAPWVTSRRRPAEPGEQTAPRRNG